MRLCNQLRFSAVALAVALAHVAAAPARACSQAPGGLIPSNYELVKGSPAIVLARAVGFQPSPENPAWGDVSFEIEEVVAGDVRAAAALTLYGNLQFSGRSPDADFSTARPGAFAGSCMAMDYRLDHRYLLFLRRYGRGWRLAGPSFSRVNEEVDGPEAPWVQTVRLYVHITALHSYDQEKAALRRLRARAAAGKEPRAPAAALVADIDRHFATPGDAKSGPDLVDLFRKAADDGVRFHAVWALAHAASPEMKGFMRQLLAGETRADWLTAVGTYFELVPDPAAFAGLAAIYVRYPPDAPQRRAIVDGLQAAAGPGDLKRLLELLRGSSTSEAVSLAFAFARHGRDPRPAIADLHRRITSENGYTRDLFLSLTLAALGDTAVVEWAERMVDPEDDDADAGDAGSATVSSASQPSRPSKDDRWTAACVLAVSPLAAADSAARELIAAGDPALLDSFIQATVFQHARLNPHRWDRLEDVLRLYARNAAVLEMLERQLQFMRDWGIPEDKAMAIPLLARVEAAAAAAELAAAQVPRRSTTSPTPRRPAPSPGTPPPALR